MGLQGMQEIFGQAQDSNRDFNPIMTSSDAKRRGIKFRVPPPESVNCQFCGALLDHVGYLFSGIIGYWNLTPIRCTCAQALKYWESFDAAQKQEKQEKELAEERGKARARYERLVLNSGIKKRFQQRTFENFTADTPGRLKAFKLAKGYADAFNEISKTGQGLYIEGSCGTGKTHLAAAIALQLINQGIPVIFKTSIDLLGDIKRTYDENGGSGGSEEEVLQAYGDVELLIIDDLGKEKCSDWSISILYSIINDRYEAMRPTIITTNYGDMDLIRALTPKGFDSLKAQAIISRLKETSTALPMCWPDWREK